jgi:hypothetical protein
MTTPRTAFRAALLAGAAAFALEAGGGAAAAEAPVEMSPGAKPETHDPKVFRPDPSYQDKPYEAGKQIDIYGGKRPIDTPRPVLELGDRMYVEGPIAGGYNVIGAKNPVHPQFQVYGDARTAIAYNDTGSSEFGMVAARLNIDVDLRLTSTERFHGFFRPIDKNNKFTSYTFSGKSPFNANKGADRVNKRFFGEWDLNPETLFFEGDVGNILAGLTDEYKSFDLPIAAGLMPLLFQNGVWADDAILGGAFSIAARNNRWLDISNYDISFFYGFDKASTPAIATSTGTDLDNNQVYGMAGFVDAAEGYWEFGVGRVEGNNSNRDLSYNSATLAFTRRYFGLVSNSLRWVGTFGQDPDGGQQQTADGNIFLIENSLITSLPLTLIPYLNGWIGFDRPQSLIRDPGAGGILKNTGILFETDGLTLFPTMDATGQNTYGGALGLEYLFNLDQQIVVEAAALGVLESRNEPGRPAPGPQYGVGIRYQIPVTNRVILRADAMYAIREDTEDVGGIRGEVRVKF